MSLVTGTTFLSLPVCDKCGWPMAGPSEVERHRKCPLVAAGANATALAANFPGVTSTKFGYGTEALVFDVDKEMHIRFDCHPRSFSLRDVWILDSLSMDQAHSLVKVLTDWSAEFRRRRS